MPLMWNGKAVQYGGGGLNGRLITGMLPLRDAAAGDPLPISRGYVTYGTDSGHQASASPPSEPGVFALNDEMLDNFAFASYKKVKDVTTFLIGAFYGRKPSEVYYFGGSEGGREALMMAQRFPADYDGVVSIVPAIGWTGLFHAFLRNELPQLTDWIEPGKASLIAKATNDACDALDGLADGIVNNYLACPNRVNLQSLRCPGGTDAGEQCLSDTELSVMQGMHSRYTFSFPVANGLTSYPQWWYGHEDSLDSAGVSLVRWVGGSVPPTAPLNPAASATHWLYSSNWIRYAVVRNANFDLRSYRPEDYRTRVQQTSELMDATSTDLSAFFARGGKLILRANASDRALSPQMAVEYYNGLVARFGQAAIDKSVRLYVAPASTHTGNSRTVTDKRSIATMVDLLDPLDRWVTKNSAPPDSLTLQLKSVQAPHPAEASRLMCRYPYYPHYTGGGALQASSYQCRVSQP